MLTFIANIELLIDLSEERHSSPEDLLLWLEDALESGELTMEEVQQYLEDYNSRRARK